jgi:hypothetical protein
LPSFDFEEQEDNQEQAVSRNSVGFPLALLFYSEHGGTIGIFSFETSNFLQSPRLYSLHILLGIF